MQLLGFTTVGMMLFMVAFALDLGGTVAALIFLLVLFIGAMLRAWAPLIAVGPRAEREAVGRLREAGPAQPKKTSAVSKQLGSSSFGSASASASGTA